MEREEEMSCSIAIPRSDYITLEKTFFSCGQRYRKECYPCGIRVLNFENATIIQRKTRQSCNVFHMEIGGFVLSVNHTVAIEELVNLMPTSLPINSLERIYFFDKVRFSIDYHLNSLQFFFNFEYEKSEITLDEFKSVVLETPLLEMLQIIFQRQVPIFDILQNTYSVARPFKYIKDNHYIPEFYALKIDGIKHTCIIRSGKMIIPTINKQISFETQIRQSLIGCVEVVGNTFYLIDLNHVLCATGLYFSIPPTTACALLNSLQIKKKDANIQVNVFYTDDSCIKNSTSIHDGYLMFFKHSIVKCKFAPTVDLFLSCTKVYKKRNDVERSLKFQTGETIRDIGYKLIDFPMDLVNNRTKIRQFYILEFTFDVRAKTLSFLRVRNDKAVANKLSTFNEMK